MLYEEFLVPKGMSQMDLSRKLGVPIQRINTLVNGKRGVTAETAWLLARVLGTTPEFWMNLQAAWDLYHAGRELGLVAGSAR
jgi:addiction module HigA family antidote